MILNNDFVECSFLHTVLLFFFFVVVIVAEMDFELNGLKILDSCRSHTY